MSDTFPAIKETIIRNRRSGGWEDYVLTGWPKPAPKPEKGGETNIDGGTGVSGIKTGFKGSTSFGIKHLSGPWVISEGDVFPGGKKPVTGDIRCEKQIDGSIDAQITDGSTWFIGDGDFYIILKVGSTEYGGRTSEDINDPWLIEGGEGLDHEWHINGNDHYDACSTEWLGGDQGNPRYVSGDDQYDASGVWDRTSEDISDGPPSPDSEGGFIPVLWKTDPTWVSGHTNSFKEKDFGVRAFDPTDT